jgi:uncharacterized protein (TIGR02147 family)
MTADQWLRKVFRRTKKGNPQLSIRSVARVLDISSSHLSKVLRGVRPVTTGLMAGLCQCLQLDHHEVKELKRLLQKTQESTPASPVIKEFATLANSEFWILERWYFLPLLALASSDAGISDIEAVVKRLELQQQTAQQALQILEQQEFIAQDEAGVFRCTNNLFRFPTQRSHSAVRKYHQDMIARALSQLRHPPSQQEFNERLMSGITFSGNSTHIEAAKTLIEEALYKATELLSQGVCNEVFQINLQMFKHTK